MKRLLRVFICFLFFYPRVHAQNSLVDSLLISDFKSSKKVDNVTKKDVCSRSTPISSLTSNDFDDLAFLSEVLNSQKYVLLGENSHSVREFNLLKVRLIKFMHSELGFNVIAFESPFSNLNFISDNREDFNEKEMLELGVYATWNTTELLELMNYLKMNPKLKIIGFDFRESNIDNKVSAHYFNQIKKVNENLGIEYEKLVVSFKKQMAEKPFQQTTSFFETNDSLIKVINTLCEQVNDHNETTFETSFHLQNLKSSIEYWSASAKFELATAMKFRDSLMSENFLEIIKNKYPDEKTIIWGHNVHMSKASLDPEYPKSMGQFLHKKINTFNIGLYAYCGTYGIYSRKIKRVKKNNFELILHENKMKYSFVDLKKEPRTDWLNLMFETLDIGHGKMSIVPSSAFDAILFFNQVSKPQYVEER